MREGEGKRRGARKGIGLARNGVYDNRDFGWPLSMICRGFASVLGISHSSMTTNGKVLTLEGICVPA